MELNYIENDTFDKDQNTRVVEIEPLLDPKNEQYTMFPIKHMELWKMYKKQQNAYWRAEEIDFDRDSDDFENLSKEEQHFIKTILSFFASSDGIVNFNLRKRFLDEIKINEALVVYGWQLMMESIHSEVYSLMLEKIIKDPVEKEALFNAIKDVESIKLMADWAFKWIESTTDFAYRLIAFACIEGIFFSGAFAAIFWLKKYRSGGKNIMGGLIESNRLIARDEGMHVKFACLLYSMIVNRLDQNIVHMIIDDAVSISKLFVGDSIRCDLIGMNLDLMNQYVEYVSDTILVMLNYDKKYNVENPFPFIDSIDLINKTNFFESRPTEYQSAFNANNTAKKSIILLDEF